MGARADFALYEGAGIMSKLTNIFDIENITFPEAELPEAIIELMKDVHIEIGETLNPDSFVDYTKILRAGDRLTIERIGEACGKTYEVTEVSELYAKARELKGPTDGK